MQAIRRWKDSAPIHNKTSLEYPRCFDYRTHQNSGAKSLSVVLYLLAGLIVLLATVGWYITHGGVIPHSLNDWASFGTYMGGVAGPLLSFIALIAVARTMHLQGATLQLDKERQLADQHLRWLEALYRDIVEALDARVSEHAKLREVLDGDIPVGDVDPKRFASRLENLMHLVTQYCQAVNLYRDNISEFFDLRIYEDRGGRLLDLIKPFIGVLGDRYLTAIEFCDMHLRGESERAEAQAMGRSSRRP